MQGIFLAREGKIPFFESGECRANQPHRGLPRGQYHKNATIRCKFSRELYIVPLLVICYTLVS